MGKAFIWALTGIGFLLLLVGSASHSNGGEIIGLLMISGGLYLALSPGGILRKEQVIDNWGVLIENAQGNAGMTFKETENFIKKSKAPSLEIKMQSMAPGFIKSLIGAKRDFLEITHRENPKMLPYQIYVNARDYGNNLDVSWYLTFRPTWWHSLLSMVPFVSMIPRTLSDLDVFDQQDLTVFATNTHHCLLKTVEKLMVSLNQDPSKIDRKSKGFLGIS